MHVAPRPDRPTGERGRPIRTGRPDRPVIHPPSVALRVLMIGTVAAGLIAVILFRLWFLQILSGQQYVAQANDNRLRSITVVAPRGDIVDRRGRVLVDNRPGLAIGIRPMDVPVGHLGELCQKVGDVLHVPVNEVRQRLVDQSGLKTTPEGETPFEQLDAHTGASGFEMVVIKDDVKKRVVSYILEHKTAYPGVEVRQSYLREYPLGGVGAHFLGYLGEIDGPQLKEQRFKDYQAGDVIGKAGVEYTYDRWLRGRDGSMRVEVDAVGRPKKAVPGGEAEQVGDSLALTIDARVQQAAERAVQFGIGMARSTGNARADAGAAVVLDVRTGGVVALASYPSFNPGWFSGGISQRHLRMLNRDPLHPLNDRAYQGLYPVGSTFKAIDAVAALEEGVIVPGTHFSCDGTFTPPNLLKTSSRTTWHCWSYPEGHGSVDLLTALTVSCDVFFYNVGYDFYTRKGTELEDWAKRLGMGHPTGLDIPGEAGGVVPTPDWLKKTFHDPWSRIWGPGNSINLAIGQGYLLATPLQLAVAYSAIANGGMLVTPHLGSRIVDSTGKLVQKVDYPAPRNLDIAPQWLDVIRQGLHQAATSPMGTSSAVFGAYPVEVCGKTGTAEVFGKGDYSWYSSFAPYHDPRYVVVVMIEQGGHGGSAAAPAARHIYDSLFHLSAGAAHAAVHSD
jgi:penicillin-binding protein 2